MDVEMLLSLVSEHRELFDRFKKSSETFFYT